MRSAPGDTRHVPHPAALVPARRTVGLVPDPLAALAALAEHSRITAASERARQACTELRWHQALRRRIPECAAESRVRGAWASAELDGARGSVEIVRDLMRGARPRHTDPDPAELVVHGAIAATALTEELAASVRTSPRRVLARLHLAAAAGALPAPELGRPRTTTSVPEYAGMGPAPAPAQLTPRLAALDTILASEDLPALLVLALAHGELAALRPFARANGLVARALDRALLTATGLDPTGVTVIEAGHGAGGLAAYHGAVQAYGQGTLEGLLIWVEHCAVAITAGAAEGVAIADAVLAGRLHPPARN